MTEGKEKTAKRVNSLESGADQESPISHKTESVFLKRSRRRRLDLRTLDGTLRESGRIYRDLAEGRISQVDAEVRSRVLGRHREILNAMTQAAQLKALQEQLAQIQNPPGLPVYEAPQLAAPDDVVGPGDESAE